MIGDIADNIIGSLFRGRPSPRMDVTLFHAHCRFTDDIVAGLAVADAHMSGTEFGATLRR